DTRNAGARRRVSGVRVNRDRAGVVELRGGRAGGGGDGVLERAALGAGLRGLVVCRGVVRDRVEAVAAVHGLFVFILRHGVVEARAAIGVGVRERERFVARLLHAQLDARNA